MGKGKSPQLMVFSQKDRQEASPVQNNRVLEDNWLLPRINLELKKKKFYIHVYCSTPWAILVNNKLQIWDRAQSINNGQDKKEYKTLQVIQSFKSLRKLTWGKEKSLTVA